MRKDVEIRHYNRFGRPVPPHDVSGHYVLKIVWHRSGQELRLAEKSGWLKIAPTKQTEFKTWQELWAWIDRIRADAAAATASRRPSKRRGVARGKTSGSPPAPTTR
jgi:ABC-type uncharacterized transport system YnjBCD substrate-binding protein